MSEGPRAKSQPPLTDSPLAKASLVLGIISLALLLAAPFLVVGGFTSELLLALMVSLAVVSALAAIVLGAVAWRLGCERRHRAQQQSREQ